ncbi:MAG: MFS transporter [Firmicutes bacterium]|nr:MFS transporter [Bacillota bacterium]
MRNNIKRIFRTWWSSITDIYSLADEDSKGRLIILTSSLLTTFYNVFITGIFYTGFLSMYGISITGAGIITFIPYIANLFTIFSSKILSRFPRRKWLLLGGKLFFYIMYILVITLMPLFVHDTDGRLTMFVLILFIANVANAPFAPGMTTWFYRFYPLRTDQRTSFITYNQIFSSILSSVILLLSSLLTDALSGSPYQDQLILIFRYFAFVLVLVDLFIQSRAKEYPYPDTSDLKLADIFTLPFLHKKFLACMLLQFFWNFLCNLNNGLWNYHLLNHMNFSYTLINTVSIFYTIILLTTTAFWKKILRTYSWIKTFGLAVLFFIPTEIFFFFMTPERSFIYFPNCMIQHFLSVGLNFSYANILYMNLPENEDSTPYIAFNTLGCNLFAFFGLIVGTAVSSISGDNTIPFLGMDLYTVQFTTLMRGACMAILGFILVKYWRGFTRDDEIVEVEEMQEERRIQNERKKQQRKLIHQYRAQQRKQK